MLKKIKYASGAILLCSLAIPTANAAVMTFENLNSAAITGWADLGDNQVIFGNAGGCNVGSCYAEDGLVIGPKWDDSNFNAHIHRHQPGLSGSTKAMSYHGDSAGWFLKTADGSAFNLDSLDLSAPQSSENTFTGGLVFNAYTGTGTDNSIGTFKGSQTIANFTDGNITLDSTIFGDINGVWVHYETYMETPTDGAAFDAAFDNITTSAVSAVPIPAAVYLFGTGLLGLMSFGKKKQLLDA